MGLKVLMWNMENFGMSAPAAGSNIPVYGLQAQITSAIEKILETEPDVFVLLEVMGQGINPQSGGRGFRGTLLEGGGCVGVIAMLKTLKTYNTESTDWCLVPPRFLSPNSQFVRADNPFVTNEAIAVFYNAKKLNFIGPYVNVQNNIPCPLTSLTSDVKPVAYTDKYAECLPSTAVTIGGVPYATNVLSGMIPDMHDAIKAKYNGDPNNLFCYGFLNNWCFLTKFCEVTDASKVYNILSFHASRGTSVHGGSDFKKSDNALTALVEIAGDIIEKNKEESLIIVADLNDKPNTIFENLRKSKVALVETVGTALPKRYSTLFGKRDTKLPLCGGEPPLFNYLQDKFSDNVILRAPRIKPEGGGKSVATQTITRVQILDPIAGYLDAQGRNICHFHYVGVSEAVQDEYGVEAMKMYRGVVEGLIEEEGSDKVKIQKDMDDEIRKSFLSINPSDHMPLFVEIKDTPPKASSSGDQ